MNYFQTIDKNICNCFSIVLNEMTIFYFDASCELLRGKRDGCLVFTLPWLIYKNNYSVTTINDI